MPKQEVRADLILGRDTLSPGLIKAGRAAELATGDVKDLSDKLRELSDRTYDASIELDGDKEASQSIDQITAKLIRLSNRKVDPEVDLAGYLRTRAEITALDLELDKLDAKHATATVDVNVNRQGLRGLLSRLGGGGGEGGGGLFGIGQSGVGSLGLPVGGGAIAGGGLIGAALVPGAVGAGLGGAVGLGAVAGGLFGAAEGKKQLNADLASIRDITTRLKGAIGEQKKTLSQALKDANKQYSKDAAFFQPFTTFQASLQGLAKTILTVLRPVMAPLTGIFNEFGKGLARLGPQFTALFQASLPFIRQFLGVMLQAGKILLPAFTQALNEMVKSGALKQMTAALVVLTRGLATFIINLGPGMAASATIFSRVATFVGRVLGFLGTLFTVIAKVLAFDFPGAAKKGVAAVTASFHAFWRDVVAIFGRVKDYLVASWNATWATAKRIVQAGVNAVTGFFRNLWHSIANTFDTIRHAIASAWDTIWRNTITRVRNGISDVTGWFRGLTGRVLSALTGLGTRLYDFGHMALTKLWNGMKNVFTSVWSWFKSLPGKLLHAIGIASPPSWAIEAGKHIMGGILHGITSRKQELMTAVGNIKYNVGAGVSQWRGLVLAALRMEGLSPALAGRVLYQMQTESGGNPNAINLTDINAQRGDPSRGLMQTIGSTFRAYHWPGTSWNIYNPLANVAAAINYARHVYGPNLGNQYGGIGSGHGYALGGLITEPIWGVGASGRRYTFGERGPEMVIPGRGGGGQVVVLEIRSGGSRVDDLLVEVIRNAVKIRGGGNVQTALGKRY